MKDPYSALSLFSKKFGATCSPRDFYWHVNKAYHAIEAANYDNLHGEMFTFLPRIWEHLATFILNLRRPLEILDIGAGTGLVGAMLNQFCPLNVRKLTLLDPSAEMLEQAFRKAQDWKFEVALIQGDISAPELGDCYDAITINSVLHHIVELDEVCDRIQAILRPGGLLLTAQDPREDDSADPVLAERKRSAKSVASGISPWKSCRRVFGRVIRKALRMRPSSPLAFAVSEILLRDGIVDRYMDMESIWAITDFHVPGQPGAFGKGISVRDLEAWMPRMKLREYRTYRFFDLPSDLLSDTERNAEVEWWSQGDRHGRLFCSIWEKFLERREGND